MWVILYNTYSIPVPSSQPSYLVLLCRNVILCCFVEKTRKKHLSPINIPGLFCFRRLFRKNHKHYIVKKSVYLLWFFCPQEQHNWHSQVCFLLHKIRHLSTVPSTQRNRVVQGFGYATYVYVCCISVFAGIRTVHDQLVSKLLIIEPLFA